MEQFKLPPYQSTNWFSSLHFEIFKFLKNAMYMKIKSTEVTSFSFTSYGWYRILFFITSAIFSTY